MDSFHYYVNFQKFWRKVWIKQLAVFFMFSFSFLLNHWALVESWIHFPGKFKPVIKKAMVELDGKNFWLFTYVLSSKDQS